MKKISVIWIGILYLLLLFPTQVFAESNVPPEGFYVQAEIPDNQRSATTSYFDLLLAPNKPQTLQMHIVNNTDEEKDLSLKVLDGVTSDNGIISYEIPKKYDQTAQYHLSDLVSGPKEVTVAARKVLTVDFELKAVDKDFPGLVLGGIQTTEKEREEEVQTEGGITNLFSYVVPIKLRTNENEVPYKANVTDIKVNEKDYPPTVRFVMQNPQPTIIRDATIVTRVYTERGKLVSEEEKKDLKFAPNTTFEPSIYLGDEPIKAGAYKVEISLKAGDLDEKWVKSFLLNRKQAKKINEEFSVISNPSKKTDRSLWLIVILVLIIVIGLALWGYDKKMKKSMRISKKTKKNIEGLLILLAVGGALISTKVYAVENNGFKSDVSLSVTRSKSADESGTKESDADDPSNESVVDAQDKAATQNEKSNLSAAEKKSGSPSAVFSKPSVSQKAQKNGLPQTGESNPLGLFLSILGCLVIISGVFLLKQRRKRE